MGERCMRGMFGEGVWVSGGSVDVSIAFVGWVVRVVGLLLS